jgi:ATP-dependent Lon protease
MIHLHVPAGATKKDGPSAGITMATAMFSLITGKKIKNRLAMTGEISLIGNVLPVGGIKEKVIAAKRSGIKEIIVPSENQKDLNELPEHIKKGITFHLASNMEEVLGYAFSGIKPGEVKAPSKLSVREKSAAVER